MRLIKKGSRGTDVKSIQYFLNGAGYSAGAADGIFGNRSVAATKSYQSDNGLTADGIIGNTTLGKMLSDGLALMPEPTEYPPKPDFGPLVSNSARQNTFGKFRWTDAPTSNNREGIKILGNWESENIVSVDLPQLSKATSGRFTRMRFHKKGAEQLRGLWAAWEREGLLHRILSYEGAFYPRYVRGSRRTLSNHSWGTAFDCNYAWNQLGRVPAAKGTKGSVRELVETANKFGFYWGGHFSRKDGMHWELAKVL